MSPQPPASEPCDCQPLRRPISRRGFLGALALGAVTVAVGPGITRAAFAADTSTTADTLIMLDCRGGMDGLSVVPPLGDPYYATLRPSIAIPASTGISVGSQMFALHPALAPLMPYWNAGTFGALQAVAQPDETRSHFSSQYELDRAAPDSSLTTGWLDRAIGVLGTTGVLQSATLGSGVADRILAGPVQSFAATTLADFTLLGSSATNTTLATAILSLHEASPLPWATIAAPTLGCVSTAAAIVATDGTPANGAVYPTGDIGSALSNVAQMIRANVGLRFVSVDMGDWDMHQGLGAAGTGWMASQAGTLATALAAFAQDIGPTALAHTSVVTISEFGRLVGENGSGGVDHGHGNAMLFLGGGLVGGQVHGTWPGLAPTSLDAGALAGTTDYRDVFADLLTNRCGLPSSALPTVFPGYTPVETGIARSL